MDENEPNLNRDKSLANGFSIIKQNNRSLWDDIIDSSKVLERIRILTDIKDEDQQYNQIIYEVKSKAIQYLGYPCRLLVLRNISEIVKNEYARSLEKISEIMVASTSHDMRTPLHTMLTMIRLIKMQVSTDTILNKYLRVA